MKKKTIIIIIMLLGLLLSPIQGMAQPEVIIDNPVFTFGAIPEGTHIVHEFIIKNSGDALLTITKVLPP